MKICLRGVCAFTIVLTVFSSALLNATDYKVELEELKKKTEFLKGEPEAFLKVDPLFAKWLQKQYIIQKRLIGNIEYDRTLKSPEAAIRVESEINDLRYMQARIKGEIEYLKNLPKDNGKVINVRDFKSSDDSKALAEAIAEAKKSGARTIFFPKGKYHIKTVMKSEETGASAHLLLENLKDILLKGEDGTEFIFGQPQDNGILLNKCNNVRVENITVKYRPLPYTIGKVKELADKGYVVTIKEGFPAPTEAFFSERDFKGLTRFYSADLLPGSVRPAASNTFSHLRGPEVEKIKDNDFLFKYKFGLPKYIKGLHVCFQGRTYGRHGVTVQSSDRCRINNVRIYASPAMSFLSLGSDMTFINNCYAGPDPEFETFAASNADGIFVRNALMGGLISGNSINYVGDDFFNTHNSTHSAYKVEKNVIYVPFWNERFLQKGFRIGWIFSSRGEKHVSGEAFIEKVEKIEDISDGDFSRGMYKVTCDRDLPALVTLSSVKKNESPDYLTIMENQFHGGVVAENTFSHGLSRVLVGGRNWLFIDNKMEDSLKYFTLFIVGPRPFGAHGGEGFQPRNIMFARNYISTSPKTLFFFSNILNRNAIKKADVLASTHIDIKDNVIKMSGKPSRQPFVMANDLSMLTVSGNKIENKSEIMAPVFELQNCNDIKIEENSIKGNYSRLYWSGKNVNDLKLKDNSFKHTPQKVNIFKAWDFSNVTDIKEWRSQLTHDLRVLPGTEKMRLEITGGDSYLYFPALPENMDSKKYGYVIIKMKAASPAESINQVYWTSGEKDFSEQNSLTLRVNEAQKNETCIYNFYMDLKNDNWSNSQVKNLRLDLFNGSPGGNIVEIDWIKIADAPIYN